MMNNLPPWVETPAPDNPALVFYNLMDTMWQTFTPDGRTPNYKMRSNRPWDVGYQYFARWRGIPWVCHGLTMFCLGQDSEGKNVYGLGPTPTSEYNYNYNSQIILFMIDAKGRFTLPFKLTAKQRRLISNATFLKQGWVAGKPVWYAQSNGVLPYWPNLNNAHKPIPYIGPHLIDSARHGWLKLVEVEDFAQKWAIAPCWDQHPPGTPSTGTNFDGSGGWEWSYSAMKNDFDAYQKFRDWRYRREMNRELVKRGLRPLSVRGFRVRANGKALTGQDAITAIAAAFDVSKPARVERWNKEAQGGPDEQLHEVESSHTTGA